MPPKFSSPTLTYSYGRDFSFRGEGFLSVRTLSGRIIVPYHGYERHVNLIRKGISGGVKLGAAKLWFDGERRRLYLLVPLEVGVREPDLADIDNIAGVDVGVRTLAVSTTLDNRVRFYRNGSKKKRKDQYARLRKELQRKGTRKAKNEGKRPRSIRRRLSVIGRRERRLMLDVNHGVAKSMVATNPRSLIGIEKLTGIRERTKSNAGGKASTKQRRANRQKSQWSFAELAALLEYKARLAGGMVVAVEAYYTSQACVKCGHTSKANRPDGGLLFRCAACECELHADLVGARNVALRALLFRQDWERTGCLSITPGVHEDPLNASSAEAKAERLKRYSELRWSSGASPVALDGATDSACQGHPRVVH